jgi:hypothetical protein
MRWMLLAGAGAVILIAVSTGVFVWASGGSVSCDEAALESAMRAGIASAERSVAEEVTIEMPSGCKDLDLADAMPRISRAWHAMPGGVMMRQVDHPGS